MSLLNMPLHSRVWLFTSNRKLEKQHLSALTAQLTEFVENWKAHGTPLSADFEIYDQAIIAVAVDEKLALPSGCSIDKVFRLLETFGNENGMDFFKRTLIVKKNAEGIEIFTKEEAKDNFQKGELIGNDLVYNTTITDLEAFKNNFLIPFSNSWLWTQLLKTGIAP